MILDLNTLAVESFDTEAGARAEPPPYTMPTNQPILCFADETGGRVAGAPTQEVILC